MLILQDLQTIKNVRLCMHACMLQPSNIVWQRRRARSNDVQLAGALLDHLLCAFWHANARNDVCAVRKSLIIARSQKKSGSKTQSASPTHESSHAMQADALHLQITEMTNGHHSAADIQQRIRNVRLRQVWS